MLLKVLLSLCYILFFVFVPLYDKAYWPEPTKKSLTFKMISATMFVSIGFIGMEMTDNQSFYSKVMLIGLVLGWIGDFFMHIPNKTDKPLNMPLVYTGAASFLIGHIFYVYAFVKSTIALMPDYKFFTLAEIIAFFVIFVAFALMLEPVFKFKYENTFMKVTLHLYSVFLIVMLIKSCKFGVTYFMSGAENGIIGMLILVIGAILFFISDLTLGLRLLGGGKGNKTIKTVSLYAYFFAQLLLATSILFIKI
ncbi:MAG: hypothetical protein IKW45_09520 [Clostridia bacterium]|nr:hypothetical protein [Clostridia bacterium]